MNQAMYMWRHQSSSRKLTVGISDLKFQRWRLMTHFNDSSKWPPKMNTGIEKEHFWQKMPKSIHAKNGTCQKWYMPKMVKANFLVENFSPKTQKTIYFHLKWRTLENFESIYRVRVDYVAKSAGISKKDRPYSTYNHRTPVGRCQKWPYHTKMFQNKRSIV